jgi:hypothetical protein
MTRRKLLSSDLLPASQLDPPRKLFCEDEDTSSSLDYDDLPSLGNTPMVGSPTQHEVVPETPLFRGASSQEALFSGVASATIKGVLDTSVANNRDRMLTSSAYRQRVAAAEKDRIKSLHDEYHSDMVRDDCVIFVCVLGARALCNLSVPLHRLKYFTSDLYLVPLSTFDDITVADLADIYDDRALTGGDILINTCITHNAPPKQSLGLSVATSCHLIVYTPMTHEQ